jgi:hypothetical protein
VSRVPAEVRYRWVSSDGDVMDNGWKTLSFPAGGGTSKQDKVVATTNNDSGTFESDISVEVQDPQHVTSNSVPFSVTCETETPTDGASSPSPSPTE